MYCVLEDAHFRINEGYKRGEASEPHPSLCIVFLKMPTFVSMRVKRGEASEPHPSLCIVFLKMPTFISMRVKRARNNKCSHRYVPYTSICDGNQNF